MCSFYTIDFDYLKHLKKYDEKVPNFDYEDHDKFFFGIVVTVNEKNYYVPVSSKKIKNATTIPIKEYSSKQERARVLGSLRLSYMVPADEAELTRLDMKWIALTKGENYANLVAREYEFCKNNIERIQRRAKRVYYFGIDPTSNYYDDCCKFLELEKALDIWKNKDEETNEDIKQEQ